jgi:hypothetical protein
MADFTPAPMNPKSFWQRPEGVTGGIFMAGLAIAGGYLFYKMLPTLISLAENTLYLGLILAGIGALLFVLLDPKARNLVWYMYKSFMRWLTGIFVQIDPIGILKSYIEDLENNLKNMNQQIGKLRGQMHKLKEIIKSQSKRCN